MDLTSQVNASLDASTNTFFVEIQFLDSILGGNPKSPEVFRSHIEARLRREAKAAVKRGDTPPSEERIQEIIARSMEEMFGSDVDTTISQQEEKAHTTFKSNEHGPYIESRQVKAMLREMMSTLGITQSKRGSKQTYQHLLAVQACDEIGDPLEGELVNQLNFHRDGEYIDEPDDYVQLVAHVVGPQGPRSCIKHHDRIFEPSIRFLVRAPANMPKTRATAVLRDDDIVKMLSHAQNDGLGACRSQAYGKFKITRLERLTNVRWVVGEDKPDTAAKKSKKSDTEAA